MTCLRIVRQADHIACKICYHFTLKETKNKFSCKYNNAILQTIYRKFIKKLEKEYKYILVFVFPVCCFLLNLVFRNWKKYKISLKRYNSAIKIKNR